MTKRSPATVIILTLVTLGIYYVVWCVKTKNELNRAHGTQIPTAWLMLVPLVNIWWEWKLCGGVEVATRGRLSQTLAFVLLWVLGVTTFVGFFVGLAIVQSKLNDAIDETVPLPLARAA